MSSEAAGVLAQCIASPDDDTPRLVWADLVGGERGELVVTDVSGGRRSELQHGAITWNASTDELTVTMR